MKVKVVVGNNVLITFQWNRFNWVLSSFVDSDTLVDSPSIRNSRTMVSVTVTITVHSVTVIIYNNQWDDTDHSTLHRRILYTVCPYQWFLYSGIRIPVVKNNNIRTKFIRLNNLWKTDSSNCSFLSLLFRLLFYLFFFTFFFSFFFFLYCCSSFFYFFCF